MKTKLLLVTSLCAASFAWANPPTTTAPASPQADNTMMNQRDASGKTLTPADQASGTKNDVELTRRIRQMVTKDNTLSIQAKNTKIITLNGVTTLRGPVTNLEESKRIENLAGQVVGAASVRNELQVKTN